jgi:hypothetical protein
VDEIDDELEFVEAFDVGKLRRIAGTNERACSTAKDCLLAKKVALRLFSKSCLDYAGARAAKFYSRMLSELTAWLAQDGIRCRKHRLILVIRKPSQEMADPAEGLAQKQIGSEPVRGRRASIALRKLKLGIMTTEHAG